MHYRYKFGYHSAPEVHHVIVAPPPPPVKYVEYVEKPIYLEKPVFKPHVEYEPAWSHPEPSPVYGLVYIYCAIVYYSTCTSLYLYPVYVVDFY